MGDSKQANPPARKRPALNGTMAEHTTRKTYDLWSRIYDDTFGRLVLRRQRMAVEQFHLKAGDCVLDLGVGTGLTLPHFPTDVKVVGMDLSQGMLAKAARKCRESQLDHCQLVCGDAMLPPMRDGSFDHILICHTISVVSEPAKLLHWARGLVKPGGRIVLLNHFNNDRSLWGKIERWLNPLCVKIGWRSDLTLEEATHGVDLHVISSFKLRKLDVWQIVVLDRPLDETPARTEERHAAASHEQSDNCDDVPDMPLAMES